MFLVSKKFIIKKKTELLKEIKLKFSLFIETYTVFFQLFFLYFIKKKKIRIKWNLELSSNNNHNKKNKKKNKN